MKRISINTTMGKVFGIPELKPYQKYLVYQSLSEEKRRQQDQKRAEDPLSKLSVIGWSPEGIANGLNFLLEEIRSGLCSLHFVYENKDISDDPQKQDVSLIRLLPEKQTGQKKPYIILAAGGAYNTVCTMVESLPAARHMVAMGYQVFLLTYRVGKAPAVPRALDDLNEAMNFIAAHQDTFHLDAARYVIGGFSAGANLISTWSTPTVGYRAYGQPKPLAALPVYTFIDLHSEAQRDENGGLLKPMLGPDYKAVIEKYDIASHIDGDYPPCYIVCGRDDAVVSPHNSELLKELLDQAGVLAELEEGRHAPHGFGDGTGTDVEGWPERAMDFVEKLL